MSFLIPDLATAFMLTFARVGTMVMLMPGIGEQLITTARAARPSRSSSRSCCFP